MGFNIWASFIGLTSNAYGPNSYPSSLGARAIKDQGAELEVERKNAQEVTTLHEVEFPCGPGHAVILYWKIEWHARERVALSEVMISWTRDVNPLTGGAR